MIAAEEVVDLGEAEITLEDIVVDWQQPRHDLADTTVGVFDGDRLVGYGDVSDGDVAYTAVLPDHQGPRHRHRHRPLGPGHRAREPARRSSAARCPRAARPTGC